MILRFCLFMCVFVLFGCETVPRGSPDTAQPRILAMGDSMLAWNGGSGRAVSHAVEKSLGENVIDRSVSGARILYALPISGALGLNISKQYVDGNWDWVILNGGGNDLFLGCGCQRCEVAMNKMVSEDGAIGAIPRMVADIRRRGAKVLYLGYLRTPGRESPIENCADEGNAFEARLNAMADRDPGVLFVPLDDVVPHGDLSFHAVDRIHPSAKGSAAIGARVAKIIQRENRRQPLHHN